MNWLIAAILAGLLSSGFHFTSRILLRDSKDSMASGWFPNAFRVLFFGGWALTDFTLSKDPRVILLLLLLGVAEMGSTFAYIRMHSANHLSISSIITRTRLFWVPVMAFIFFGEQLQAHEYAGIIILFVGLAIVSSPKNIQIDKGIKFAYLFGFAAAFHNIVLKLNQDSASLPVVMLFMSAPVTIMQPLLMKNGIARIKKSVNSNIALQLINGAFGAVSIVILAYAINVGQVSKVSAIQQGMLIVSVMAGIIFLNERENVTRKIIGSLITLAGVYLLTLI